mmetsp:Transcript_41723/g.105190  ORF Transcript_41723/g.105190 Transcript_41723/m.105190 type:complete len:93 (+) Transcript_41723:1661-1939(+)
MPLLKRTKPTKTRPLHHHWPSYYQSPLAFCLILMLITLKTSVGEATGFLVVVVVVVVVVFFFFFFFFLGLSFVHSLSQTNSTRSINVPFSGN